MSTNHRHDDHIRVGNAERETVTNRLAEAHALGQLDVEEFNTRVEAAYDAKTRGQLAALTSDLPSPRRDRREWAGTAAGAARAAASGNRKWAMLIGALIAFAMVGMLTMPFDGPHEHDGFPWMPVILIAIVVMYFKKRARYRASRHASRI